MFPKCQCLIAFTIYSNEYMEGVPYKFLMREKSQVDRFYKERLSEVTSPALHGCRIDVHISLGLSAP